MPSVNVFWWSESAAGGNLDPPHRYRGGLCAVEGLPAVMGHGPPERFLWPKKGITEPRRLASLPLRVMLRADCRTAMRFPARHATGFFSLVPWDMVASVAHGLRPSANRCAKRSLALVVEGHGRHQLQHLRRSNIAVLKESHAELAVLLPSGHGLRQEDVDHVQAVTHPIFCVAILDSMHSLHTVLGQSGSARTDSLGIVAKCPVELRAFAYDTVDFSASSGAWSG